MPCRWSSLRRELGEVVDAQLLLDGGDLIDRLLEAFLPEQAVFLFLELLAEFLPSLLQISQGKERRLLLLDYRSVHGDRGGDDPADEVGLVQFLAVNKDQREVEEAIIQVVERLEEMPGRVVDRLFFLTHRTFLLE